MVQEWSMKGPKKVKKRSKIDPRMVLEWSKKFLRKVQEWSNKGPRMIESWKFGKHLNTLSIKSSNTYIPEIYVP